MSLKYGYNNTREDFEIFVRALAPPAVHILLSTINGHYIDNTLEIAYKAWQVSHASGFELGVDSMTIPETRFGINDQINPDLMDKPFSEW